MAKKTTLVAALALIASAALPSLSQAQSLVKRVKCADAASTEFGLGAFRNTSNYTARATLQIVRDGCSPKKGYGVFSLHVTNYDGNVPYSNRQMPREGKHTWAVRENVEEGRVMRVKFNPKLGAKVHGTFDYVLILD